MAKRESRGTGDQSGARGRGNGAGDYPSSPLVGKHDFLIAVTARDQGLRRAPLAVLAAILAHYNESERAAWPSFNLIAAECGINPRTAKRAVAALAKRGYLVIQPGTRTTSNRYRFPLERVQKLPGRAIPVVANGPPGVVATTPPGVVAQQTRGSGEPVPDVVAHRPPELSYQPGYEPGVDREMDDIPGTPPEGRFEAPSGPPPDVVTRDAAFSDQYPAFWQAYPKRIQVHATEAKLRQMEQAGAPMADILAGARRYAEYVIVNPKLLMTPVRWLEEQRWRDSWTIATSKATPGRTRTTSRSKAATRPAAGTRTTARPAKATTTAGKSRPQPPAKAEPKHQVVTQSAPAPALKAPTAEEVAAREAARIREAQAAQKRAQFERDYQAERDQTFTPWPEGKAMENALAFYDATRPQLGKYYGGGMSNRDIAILDLHSRLVSGNGKMEWPNNEYRTSLREFLEWHQAQEQTLMPGGEHAG